MGSAAIAAAAQVGALHGLALAWRPAEDGWPRLLTWVPFVFATAVLAGAATRRARVARRMSGPAGRLASALAAGLGAALAFPLVWVPVRADPPPGTHAAELAVAVAAAAGIALGMVLAVAALSAAPIAYSVVATAAWVWLFALISVGAALASGRPPRVPWLGTIDVAGGWRASRWWLGPYLMIVVAAALGVAVAALGRWLDARRLGIALSGIAGPALVAAAYLVTGPRVQPAYVAGLVAATAGLFASTVLAAAPRREPVAMPVSGPPVSAPPVSAPPAVTSPPATPPRPTPTRATPTPATPPPATPSPVSRPRAVAPKPRAVEAPAAPVAVATPAAPADEGKRLRKREREHVSWIQNLIDTPPDPTLRRERHPTT